MTASPSYAELSIQVRPEGLREIESLAATYHRLCDGGWGTAPAARTSTD
ncbi:MAG: hypothetical protein Q8Q02_10525 [Nocardioides sp.]|nr:hypothetical protein [Nocardioides sp.]